MTPSAAYYYLTDNQGSVIGLADIGGTVHAAYTYTPYGTQTATAENGSLPSNPYGWDGGYTDSSTGVTLIHFGARYYDPATGRWTQLDSSGQSAGYAYANDDPINSSDTSGELALEFSKNGARLVAALIEVGRGAVGATHYPGGLSGQVLGFLLEHSDKVVQDLLSCANDPFATGCRLSVYFARKKVGQHGRSMIPRVVGVRIESITDPETGIEDVFNDL